MSAKQEIYKSLSARTLPSFRTVVVPVSVGLVTALLRSGLLVCSHRAVDLYGSSPSLLRALGLSVPLAMLSSWGTACSGCGMAEVPLGAPRVTI